MVYEGGIWDKALSLTDPDAGRRQLGGPLTGLCREAQEPEGDDLGDGREIVVRGQQRGVTLERDGGDQRVDGGDAEAPGAADPMIEV